MNNLFVMNSDKQLIDWAVAFLLVDLMPDPMYDEEKIYFEHSISKP